MNKRGALLSLLLLSASVLVFWGIPPRVNQLTFRSAKGWMLPGLWQA